MTREAETESQTWRRAVFLDRDGTIIEDVGYLRDPGQVRLLPGVGPAIRRLNTNGWLVLVVTNQSGIARGLLTEGDYQRSEQRLDELLGQTGAHIDSHYYCPHLPDMSGPCQCRKPGTLLYRQAAERFGIDLQASWWVGDRARDVLPAAAFGAHAILVLGSLAEPEPPEGSTHRVSQAADLPAAVELILRRQQSAGSSSRS